MFATMQNPPLAIHTPLGVDAVRLLGFRGTTGLSQLYRFELDLRLPPPGVAFDALLGQPATVRLRSNDGQHHFFHGILARLERVEQTRTHVQYQALLVSKFWLLTKRVQSRVFQQQSVPEILKEVLTPLRPDVDFKLRSAEEYQPRDFCVQYGESDFAFASRLMEEEGLFYYFEHSDSGHRLIVTDTPTLLPTCADSIAFDNTGGGVRDRVRIDRWRKAQEVASSAFTLWDQCFELPDRLGAGFRTLEARSRITDRVRTGAAEHRMDLGLNQPLEVYEYPSSHARDFDGIGPEGNSQPQELAKIYDLGTRRAARRAEAEAAHTLQIAGTSDAPGLTPGGKFRVTGLGEDDGEYYVTRVEHRAILGPEHSADHPSFEYDNRFECLPGDLPYRSLPQTPRPAIHGVQTATVVGPSTGENGTPPHVDKYGRVKVQFHWDRRRRFDNHSSCWIRVSQPWAGPRWGAFFWPRPGHEVVVAFEHGDPDRPIITGSVYNAANMPPVELPTSRLTSGIVSCSPEGDPLTDFNCVVFHDRPGHEFLQVHSNLHESNTTTASRTHDTTGRVVESFGRLALPAVGSGSGGGAEEQSFGADTSAKQGTKYDVPGLINKIVETAGGRVDGPAKTALGFITDWKKGVKKLVRNELLGPWFGDAFPSKTEYICGDQVDVHLCGRATEHRIWGEKHEYNFAHPVDLAESVLKDFLPFPKIKNAYQYATMVLKAGPEPAGKFDMLLDKHTELKYYGPFVGVSRGKSYEYEGEKFSITSKGATDRAAFWLTLATYAAMSIGDILGRKKNTFNAEGATTYEDDLFLNLNLLASKFAGLLSFLETKNATKEQAKEDAKRTEEQAKLAALWQLKFANATVRADLDNAKQRIADTLEALGDLTGVSTPLVPSTRKSQLHKDRYSLTARDLTFVAEDDPLSPINAGNISMTARKSPATGGGEITLTAGDKIVLQTANNGNAITLSGDPTDNLLDIFNESPGKLALRQGFLPGAPEITLEGGTGPDSIVLQCGVAPAASKIEISASGMELSFGPPMGGAMIKMSSEGIVLKVGITSVLKITAAGIELEGLKFKEQFQTVRESSALALQQAIKAMNKNQAGVQMNG